MQIVVPISPTTVNVLTDLFLVGLQLLWHRAMMMLTAADTRRSLRLGVPLPTYEHLGTHQYISLSFSNYRRHKASLERPDKRWFQWSILKGLVALLITLGMVGLHFVIDLGLDFDTQMKLTNTNATYSAVAFQPRPEYRRYLTEFNVTNAGGLDIVRDQCEEQDLQPHECRALARSMDDHITSQLREGVTFDKVLYTASTLGSVDVLDELTFVYKTVRDSTGENFPECVIVEQRDVEGFNGDWELSHSDCVLGFSQVRSATIDMRARAASQESFADASRGGSAFDKQYLSFANFKDERAATSKARIQAIDAESEGYHSEDRADKWVRLTVDSGVKYLPGEQQRIRLMYLTPGAGDNAFRSRLWHADDRPLGDDVPPEQLCVGTRETPMLFEGTKLEFGGGLCTHDVYRAVGDCGALRTNVEENGENGVFEYYVADTATFLIVRHTTDLSGTGDTNVFAGPCGDKAFEFFAEQMARSEPKATDEAPPDQASDESTSTRRYILLGGLNESVCAVDHTNDGRILKCVMGAEYVRWDGHEWSDATGTEPDQWTVRLRQDLAPRGIEITGGNPSEVISALENVAAIVSGNNYVNLRKFTSGASSPQMIYGVHPGGQFRAFIAAMATQIGPTERTTYIYEPSQVTVLKGTYVYTIAVLIALSCASLLVAILRERQEAWKWRDSPSTIKKIPLNRTDWVAFLLKSCDRGSADGTALRPIDSHEYTSRYRAPDVEENGAHNRDDGPTSGKLGFFKTLEPLKAGVDYK